MASILLADDDAAVRELVSRALIGEGHSVHVTQDGLEAFELFEARGAAFDLVVSDVEMPQLDGVSLVKQVLAQKPTLAIVLMSGFSDQLDRAQDLGSRRLISISKPFTLEQIKQAVKAALES